MSDPPKPVETFDDLPEVMICPECGGWRHWQSMEGNWHCAKCNPPTKGLFWMKRVERARRRHHKPIRPEAKQLIADIQELVQ
jgi:ribosomal protein L37AE/L43A